MRPTFLFALVALSLTGAAHARPADPKPAPVAPLVQKDALAADVTAPFPSITFDGLKPVKDPRGGVFPKDNSLSILSVSFGMSNTVNIGSQSSGVGAGKPRFTEITFQRTPDADSAELLRALANGTAFPRATIRLKSGIVATLGLVAVTNYQITQSGNEPPVENVTLAVGQIDFQVVDYATKKPIGKSFSWDIVKNVNRVEYKVDLMPLPPG